MSCSQAEDVGVVYVSVFLQSRSPSCTRLPVPCLGSLQGPPSLMDARAEDGYDAA